MGDAGEDDAVESTGTDWAGPEDDAQLQLLSRSELEARVRERTTSLQNLMDTMVDVLLQVDADGRVVEANAAVESVLGYDRTTVVGKPVDYLFAEPADATEAALTAEELIERLVVAGQVTDVAVQFETADGEAVPMSLSASVMHESAGLSSGVVCVAKDISERVAAQERAEFLHSLLRHNLGNRLQITQGYLDVLETVLAEATVEDLDSPALDGIEGGVDGILEELRYGVDGAIELVEDVRALREARDEQTREPVAVERVLRAAIRGYEEAARQAGMSVEVEVASPPAVLANSLLDQLFSNLIENAIEHSEGSLVRVSTTTRPETVAVVVEDDGVGVAPERRAAILERGERGADSEGSGLGMHLVSLIAEQHGELRVGESELGGARFEVRIERADPA
jgi:PAS domain S-box-containing protein